MLNPILNSIRNTSKAGKKGRIHHPSISPFERCPAKLCKIIFTYACDDDGSTSRSLSLVSRYIHSVSADLRFRCLAVCGMKQIFFCAVMLKKKPPHLRRITHLFISGGSQVRPGETKADIDEWIYSTDTHHGSGCTAFLDILTMAAPTMKTLYVSSPCARPMVMLNIVMPELEELIFFNEIHSTPVLGPPHETYPKLRRLRFTGCNNISHTVLVEICTRAPSITHLCFQMDRTGDDFLEHLASAFGLQGIRHNHHLPPLPQKFLNQIVEVGVETPNKKKGFQGKMYERLIQRVTTLEPRIRVTTVPVAYFIPFCYSLQDWLRDSTREWNFPTPHRFVD